MQITVNETNGNSQAIINVVKSVDAEAREAAGVTDQEIPEEPQAATGIRVVKLDTPARDRAAFVVREIKRT